MRIKTSGLLDVLKQTFKQLDKDVYSLIIKLENNPLSIKELAISGNELQSLGIKGRELGLMIEELLTKIWIGELDNERNSLEDYINNHK